MDGLERPAIALVENGATPHEDPFTPLVLRPGPSRGAPTPFSWLHRRRSDAVDERSADARSAMMARLADGEKGGALEDLTAGFALYYAARAQVSHEAEAELPDACLDRFRAAALARTPDATVRRTWEALAKVLAAGRSVDKIYAYVRPVAEKHRPWLALEEALARADIASQKPQDALKRLEPLKESAADDFAFWYLLGESQCAAGDAGGALASWKRASKLRTADAAARRRVVFALVRVGDDEGIAAARKLLQETPGDQELQRLLDEPIAPGPTVADPCAR
jgi:predicted Zn-dependent protease